MTPCLNGLLPEGFVAELAGECEWKITVDIPDRDSLLAAALVMIYVLLVGQTGSLTIPLVMR